MSFKFFTKRCLALCLILLSCQINLFAQMTSEALDKLVEKSLEKFHVAGAAVAVIKDGKVIHAKGYGLASADTKKKINEHTNFAIASHSKAFTAAALAILIEEGKLSWDDKVRQHLPEFKMYAPYVTENFTIKDLLTHRSGLPLGMGDLMFIPDGSTYTIKDVMNSFQYSEPVSPFRTNFHYNNQLYFVAGEVVKRVSGQSWENFVYNRIIQPLGMGRTYASFGTRQDKTNYASPHNTDTGKLRTLPLFEDVPNGAAAGVLSNIHDLSKWVLLHLNKGKYGKDLEKSLFSEKNHSDMWMLHTSIKPNNKRYNTHFFGYGLGWFLADMKGQLMVWHTGGLPGMLSKTVLFPDMNLGIICLTNTESGGAPLFSAVTQTIIDSYLDMNDRDWVDFYAKRAEKSHHKADSVVNAVWKTVKANEKTSLPFKDYIGTYEDKWFGKVTIYEKNASLWFKSERSANLEGQMFYYKANSFAIKWNYRDMNGDAFAIFSLDEEGKAQRIRMKGISPNIDFSFDFEHLDLKRIPDEKEK